uniref:Ovule protein n=1 Tax=Syphacia muris TaxID=451379 RepID=A0A0N5AWH6_9BILA
MGISNVLLINGLRLRPKVFYNNQCWFSRLLEDTTMNLFGITMAAMAIERMIATVAARNYEKSESEAVSTLLISLQVTQTSVTNKSFSSASEKSLCHFQRQNSV